MQKRSRLEVPHAEELFVPAVTSEHTEMYLKAIWLIQERGEVPARIGSIARLLKVTPPSVVDMLKELSSHGYVTYMSRKGAKLTDKGAEIGKRMIRNTRLIEVLMKERLHVEVDERIACGIEHHMSGEFADALCILLDHPKKCHHGNAIPFGNCCT